MDSKDNSRDIKVRARKLVYEDGHVLLSHHHQHLQSSGLNEETIREAGIYSETSIPSIRSMLGYSAKGRGYGQKNGPAIVFPVYDIDGHIAYRRIRPDNAGNQGKYRSPRGSIVRPYLPKAARDARTGAGRMFFTEGEKKALCLCQSGFAAIGIFGVTMWHEPQKTSLLPDLELFRWQGRDVFIVFDSDAATKPEVAEQEKQLARALGDAGANVLVVRIPPAADGGKQGADDFIVANGAAAFEELVGQAVEPDPVLVAEVRVSAKHSDPANAAARMVNSCHDENGSSRLRFYRGDWWYWAKGRYKVTTNSELRARVSRLLSEIYANVNSSFISSVIDILRGLVLVPEWMETPHWIGEAPVSWNLRECIPTRKSLVHLPSIGTGQIAVTDATPRLFVSAASDVEFATHPPEPAGWLNFLSQLWPDDIQSIESLQEWFGYCLTPDTRQQKIMLMIGPKRSGKGTICRTLTSLIGRNNVANPTLASLAQNFGLSPLIDKTLAIVGDARISGRTDAAIVIERLLSISGEDALTIDRKHRELVTTQLKSRLMIVSNELPRLRDDSQALANRFIVLQMRRSFFGQEDHFLSEKLEAELPGIMLWAIEGWKRLRERGRLREPDSSSELRDEFAEVSSPISSFVEQCCSVGEQWQMPRAELYNAYKSYCNDTGRQHIEDEAGFGRGLRAIVPNLTCKRPRIHGRRIRIYCGISVNGWSK